MQQFGTTRRCHPVPRTGHTRESQKNVNNSNKVLRTRVRGTSPSTGPSTGPTCTVPLSNLTHCRELLQCSEHCTRLGRVWYRVGTSGAHLPGWGRVPRGTTWVPPGPPRAPPWPLHARCTRDGYEPLSEPALAGFAIPNFYLTERASLRCF